MVWTFIFVAIFFISLISLIGVFSLFIAKKKLNNFLVWFVSFTAGILLGDVFLHLLPELIEEVGEFNLFISFGVLVGISTLFIIEKIVHWHHCHKGSCEHKVKPFGYMNLIGDSLHNFLDGIIIASSFLISIPVGFSTTIAVILHEIPQEIGDFGVLLRSGFSTKKALFFNFLSGLISFFGALLVFVFAFSEEFLFFFIAFTVGNFIYISLADLVPELHKEANVLHSFGHFVLFLVGIFIMYLLTFLG